MMFHCKTRPSPPSTTNNALHAKQQDRDSEGRKRALCFFLLDQTTMTLYSRKRKALLASDDEGRDRRCIFDTSNAARDGPIEVYDDGGLLLAPYHTPPTSNMVEEKHSHRVPSKLHRRPLHAHFFNSPVSTLGC